ncbi:hypothetical protein J120_02940 [candidate division TM6 bacterium JCVI TM6SC1]|uniref:Uncharacterized protein n=1 Tax=candidate division TM6 bacterium JCVI TM6SC1 TaxID=1306947 RepID=A0A0D2JLQ0_9BACT|nr:hypothetical protein J120_02940 [candidate division TM6 bacterium JCVI TM6SC1]
MARARHIAWSSWCISCALLGLVILSIIGLHYNQQSMQAYLIGEDITQLVSIFADIDATAGIAEFEHTFNWIDFLTIKKNGFLGSQVGSLILARPERWNGPYVSQHICLQSVKYQVIKTDKGYFIIPGNGARLPDGRVMGVDLILTENSDIDTLINTGPLTYHAHKLAAPVIITPTTTMVSEMQKLNDQDEDI